MEGVPDRLVGLGILHASRVSVLFDVDVDVLHQEVGREDSMDKVASDIEVIKVILEQRGDLHHHIPSAYI